VELAAELKEADGVVAFIALSVAIDLEVTWTLRVADLAQRRLRGRLDRRAEVGVCRGGELCNRCA
jgi:hypothetical protein